MCAIKDLLLLCILHACTVGVFSHTKDVSICDRACENRACGLKYTMLFDETYLYTEVVYFDSVSSVVKPNKLSTNC